MRHKSWRYFEIIVTTEVVAVGKTAQEDSRLWELVDLPELTTLGVISKEQYKAYSQRPWKAPVSKMRYRLVITSTLEPV